MDYQMLFCMAQQARMQSYSPYSGFAVGAALLCGSGRVFTGCNVENLSFGATVCAERVAACKAVSEGERDFIAIAVYAGGKETSPCGICLQTLREFSEDMDIVLSDPETEFRVHKLSELMPLCKIPLR